MKLSAVVSIFAAFGCSQTFAHGFLAQPLAMFMPDIDITRYAGTIISNNLFPNGSFGSTPEDNVKAFVEHYKKSKYKSLKDMINENMILEPGATRACGFTLPEKTSYGALNDTVYWGRNVDITLDVGFNHPGSCETHCDEKRVQEDTQCDVTYAASAGASPVPIDVSSCTGAKRFTIYWIAVHSSTWQVYINCVNINGGTGGADSIVPSETNTATPTSQTTPTATPATPSTSDENQYQETTPAASPVTTATSTTPDSDKQATSDASEVKVPSTTIPSPTSAPKPDTKPSDAYDTPPSTKCSRRRIRR